MSAQKELAELMALVARGDAILGQSLKGRHATNRKCAEFLRDHGPAIAELIEAAAETCENQPGTYSWLEKSIRKLTEPKA